MNRYFIVFLCVLTLSIGQILFKLSANTLKSLDSMWLLAFEPAFILAIALYGFTTIGWIWCLKEIPLGQAYLFMSSAYVIVPLLAWLCFNEVPSMKYLISSALIIAGIVFAAC